MHCKVCHFLWSAVHVLVEMWCTLQLCFANVNNPLCHMLIWRSMADPSYWLCFSLRLFRPHRIDYAKLNRITCNTHRPYCLAFLPHPLLFDLAFLERLKSSHWDIFIDWIDFVYIYTMVCNILAAAHTHTKGFLINLNVIARYKKRLCNVLVI